MIDYCFEGRDAMDLVLGHDEYFVTILEVVEILFLRKKAFCKKASKHSLSSMYTDSWMGYFTN